jgi:hypothetical protein
MTAVGKTIFDRLGRPPHPKKTQNTSPAQRLLDWLQHWSKPTICARDICNHGPCLIRKREDAGKAAEVLVKNGWLIPTQAHRRDRQVSRIVRKPTLYPDCRSVAD